MQQIQVKLSLEEIRALLEMVENPLFRMKFIDSKMPGHKANPESRALSPRPSNSLQEAFRRAKGFETNGASLRSVRIVGFAASDGVIASNAISWPQRNRPAGAGTKKGQYTGC